MTRVNRRQPHGVQAPNIGDHLPSVELTISAEKMKTAAALLADPNPIHFDVEAVQALGLGDQPVNQGPLNMGYIMNMLADFSGSHDRLKHLKVRFLANVFAGDRVQASGTVIGIHPTPDGDGIEVECNVALAVVDDRQVLSGTATVFIPAQVIHATTDNQ